MMTLTFMMMAGRIAVSSSLQESNANEKQETGDRKQETGQLASFTFPVSCFLFFIRPSLAVQRSHIAG